MRQKLHTYLASRPQGATTQELLEQLFADDARETEFGSTFLRRLLADDPRFAYDGSARRWRVVNDHLFSVPLSEVCFTVVDLEATGNRMEDGGITEIGAIRIQDGREVGRFEQLINPGRPIPQYVTALTGISDAMVRDAPAIEDVIGGFCDFASESVIVAHNASFDFALLSQESWRVLGMPLGCPSLCTIDLVRYALPELEKTSLDAVAEHFQLEGSSRHRAMADAELTAHILERVLEIYRARGVSTLEELAEAEEGALPRRRFHINIGQSSLERLPSTQGVYRLSGHGDRALLVGRAANLHDRVQQFFLGSSALSERQLGMVSEVRSIDFVATSCELGTLLEEAAQVRAYDPLFNRAGKHLPKTFYVKLTVNAPVPRLHAASRLVEDGAIYVGPLKRRPLAEEAAQAMATVFGVELGPAAIGPRSRARTGAEETPGGETAADTGYLARVRVLADALQEGAAAFKQAVTARTGAGVRVERRLLGVLSRLTRLGRRVDWLVSRHYYVALLPPVEGVAKAVVVLGGRYCGAFPLATSDDVDHVLERIEERMEEPQAVRTRALEADASNILAHWMQGSPPAGDETRIDLTGSDLTSVLMRTGEVLRASIKS